MDDRFPRWLRFVVRKLDFVSLPNLGILLCALAVLGFIGRNFMDAPFERFLFDPQAVMNGEVWRLFAFPGTETGDSPIYLLFYVLYIYFVMTTLEAQWGGGPLTVFTLFSYACAIAASFFAGRPLSIWWHVMENVSLAFGTLFPNIEFYLYFILPVKAKWLAMLAAALLLYQIATGSWYLVIALIPYLVFFSPMLYRTVKNRGRRGPRRFDGDMWK